MTFAKGEEGDPVGVPQVRPVMGVPADSRGFAFGTSRHDLPGLLFRPTPPGQEGPSESRQLGQAFVAGQRGRGR